MATAHDKAMEYLKSKGLSDSQINSATSAIKAQQNAGKSSKEIQSNIKSSLGSMGITSNSNAGSTSSTGTSGLTSKDTYGDVSGKSTATGPMDFSSNTGKKVLGNLAVFGDAATAYEQNNPGSIEQRNNIIAGNLNYEKNGQVTGKDVEDYLNKQIGFSSASKESQANTIRAIKDRLGIKDEGEVGTAGGGTAGGDISETVTTDIKTNIDGQEVSTEAKAGFYRDSDGNYYKIYGYDELPDQYKNLLDNLDDSKKKEVSNKRAQGMQEEVKYYLDSMREKDQLTERQKINEDLHENDMDQFAIQTEQTIRNAEESYNNLKQNRQYLGNMGMPGTSSTKIQAIGDAIGEAKTQLGELKKLISLQKEAKEKNWEGQVLQYTQQIDNIMYDLKWKVGDEITGALSKFTTAELEGKLDTIDGITAFKRELLDELDNNLSGITSASLSQMQYINQEYQKIADKAYEYAQNANVVNKDMSSVRGFYVDGNGNPILDSQGNVIKSTGMDWMDPVFNKDTGQLVTFTYDENGNRTASVQQLWDNNMNSVQGTIAAMLQNGASVSQILSSVPGADAKTVQSIADLMGVRIKGGVSTAGVGGNTGYLNIPRNVNGFKDNVGADTNNFGNFTSAVAGYIGMYKSNNGRSYAVFANAQDGYNALVNDLKNKQSGNTKTGLNGDSTVKELCWTWINGGKYPGDETAYQNTHFKNYLSSFKSASGLDANAKIGTASTDALAYGIMAGEGTLAAYNKGGVDLSAYANESISPTYDENLSFVFENMLANKGKLDATTQKSLLDQGYTLEEIGDMYNNFKAVKGVSESGYKLPDGFVVTDEGLFNQLNDTKKKDVEGTMASYKNILDSKNKLKDLVLEYGTEVRPTDARNKMEIYVRDLQLQAKELYNLGVLNGPDLQLMESVIKTPVGVEAKWKNRFRSNEDLWKNIESGIDTVNEKAINKLKGYGISVINNSNETPEVSGGRQKVEGGNL